MELFTLKPNFLPDKIVDGFLSAIWTERFFTFGDVQIVVPAKPEYRTLLAEGTFLGLRGSKEVMLLQNHNIENGLLTVTGNTLDEFLNTRQAWFQNPDITAGQSSTAEYKATTTAGQIIADVVTNMVINPVAFAAYVSANLDWVKEKISSLSLGEVDTNGESRPRTFPVGPLYDGIKQLATANGLGFRLYLDSVTETGYSLKFAIWRGQDRTSQQSANKLVRLSPSLNSLLGTKEILSIAAYKNVVYVHYKNEITTHYAEPSLPIPEGFNRRSFVRMADGDVPPEQVAAYRAQHAADAIANNNYIRAIDGQASIPSQYKYQRDYRLGDIIELEGLTGILAKARVTEYIRSQDQLGSREYPTISVVDPLDSGNMPTLNPGPGDFAPDDPGSDYPATDPYPDPDPVDPDPDPDPDPGNVPSETPKPPTSNPDPSPYSDPPPSPNPYPDPVPNPGPDPDPDPDPDPAPAPDPDAGPWTPGPHPSINYPLSTFFMMRDMPWVADPAKQNLSDMSQNYLCGTMNLAGDSNDDFRIIQEFTLDGFSYGDPADEMKIGLSLGINGVYSIRLYTAWAVTSQGIHDSNDDNYLWPGKIIVKPYIVPGTARQLDALGSYPAPVELTMRSLSWYGNNPRSDPSKPPLPTLSGRIATWVYKY